MTQQKGVSADGKMAAVMLQMIPSFFLQIIQRTASLFLQTPMNFILCVKNTGFLATMTRCDSYPIADITLLL